MSDLSELQFLHPLLVARLINFADSKGYKVKWGECYRTPEQAALNAKSGKGISNSLHTQRLAVDLMLFKDGVYLTQSEDYEVLGVFWKTLDPRCCWGGDFRPKPDGDHFSLTFQGVK